MVYTGVCWDSNSMYVHKNNKLLIEKYRCTKSQVTDNSIINLWIRQRMNKITSEQD